MDLKTLEDLFASRVEVKHGKHTLALNQPNTAAAVAVVSRFAEKVSKLDDGDDARAPFLEALAEAVELTLEVDDGDLPEGIGMRVVMGSGGLGSPVGRAAAKLVGLNHPGEREDDEDLPT